jgi:hypothetical protein
MKSKLATLAAVVFTVLAAAPKAEARHPESRIYISGYLSCGSPVYTERYLIGYDRCGHPVWGTRVIRHEAAPRYRRECAPVYQVPSRYVSQSGRYGKQHGYSYGHGDSYGGRGAYEAPCRR